MRRLRRLAAIVAFGAALPVAGDVAAARDVAGCRDSAAPRQLGGAARSTPARPRPALPPATAGRGAAGWVPAPAVSRGGG